MASLFSSRARSAAALIVAALVIGAIVLAIIAQADLARATAWVRHTDAVRVAIARLAGTLVDAESGHRGYMATGDPKFLEPALHARAEWRGELDEVRRLTTDSAEQQVRLAHVDQLARLLLLRLADTAGSAQALPPSSRTRQRMLEDDAVMRDIRVALDEMQTIEERLDDERATVAARRQRLLLVALLVAGMAFVPALAFQWRGRRELARQTEVSAMHERNLRFAEQFIPTRASAAR